MSLLSPDISFRQYWGMHKASLAQFASEYLPQRAKVVDQFPHDSGKHVAITGGMFGAGTTWTFNILRNASLGRRQSVFSTYAEDITLALVSKLHSHDVLILKGHMLGEQSSEFVRLGIAKLFAPVRDPRDAICSLMNRFDYSFASALRSVAHSAENILTTQINLPHLALRYEDGFMNEVHSVEKICAFLGWGISKQDAHDLLEELRPEKVKSLIKRLEEDRTIARTRPKYSADKETSWHPNHVGDMKIGKYHSQLSSRQLEQANERLRKFIEHFGY